MFVSRSLTAPSPTARFLGGLVVRPVPEAMKPARVEFRDLLTMAAPLLDPEDSILMLSELLTNACRHVKVRDPWLIRVRCWRDGNTLRVEVHDPGSGELSPRSENLDACDGRGLLLVEALSATWGSGPAEGGGTVVWFTVEGAWRRLPFYAPI